MFWALWVILAVAMFLAICLLWRVWIIIRLETKNPTDVDGTLEIRFFSGMIRLRYRMGLHVLDRERFFLFYKEGHKEKTAWRPGGEKKETSMGAAEEAGVSATFPIKELWENVRLKSLRVEGQFGIEEDAFYTVMLTGVLATTIQNICIAATVRKDQRGLYISIVPAFNKTLFRLNMEGILFCPPIQIISIILIYTARSRKGKRTAWHILSKTS